MNPHPDNLPPEKFMGFYESMAFFGSTVAACLLGMACLAALACCGLEQKQAPMPASAEVCK